jgi:hypothetical protein
MTEQRTREQLRLAELRRLDVDSFGAVLAESKPHRPGEQRVTVHADPAGVFWMVAHGGSTPDFQRALAPEEAAEVARILHLTPAGRAAFAARGLDAAPRAAERLVVRASWHVGR